MSDVYSPPSALKVVPIRSRNITKYQFLCQTIQSILRYVVYRLTDRQFAGRGRKGLKGEDGSGGNKSSKILNEIKMQQISLQLNHLRVSQLTQLTIKVEHYLTLPFSCPGLCGACA